MARPERFELPTLWFEVVRSKFTSRLFGVAYVQNARRSSFSIAPDSAPKLSDTVLREKLTQGSHLAKFDRLLPQPCPSSPKAPRAFVTNAISHLANGRSRPSNKTLGFKQEFQLTSTRSIGALLHTKVGSRERSLGFARPISR